MNSPFSKSIWVVCPVFFDTEAFLILRDLIINELSDNLKVKEAKFRFFVADDSAGQDKDIRKLESVNTEICELPFNVGHQRAIVYALRELSKICDNRDLIITLDSDGEDRPTDIKALLEPLLASDKDFHLLSLAQRTKRRESLVFKTMYFFYKKLFKMLTGTIIRSGNFAAFNGGFLKRHIWHPYFDLCYSSTLVRINSFRSFVPCERGKRLAGKTKMNFLRLVAHGIQMLMPFIDQISIRILFAFCFTLAISVMGLLLVLVTKYFTGLAIPGWTTNAFLGLCGLSLISLGNVILIFSMFAQSQGALFRGLSSGKISQRPEGYSPEKFTS